MIGKQLNALYAVDRTRVKPIVAAALKDLDGNVTATAKRLSLSTRTLWRWFAENDWSDLRVKSGRVMPR